VARRKSNSRKIDRFDFKPGKKLVGKYQVVFRLGSGWESEVYKLRELSTGIERAAKFFFPHRNKRGAAARFYAKKLHKLRHCPILIQYHTQETICFEEVPVTFLVSEYVEGELLSDFLARQRGRRLSPFQGLHLLHALAAGMESIHHLHEYHGDLHTENVIVQRYGISFDLKLLDMFHWGAATNENIHDDVCDLIRIFYDAIGGAKHYSKHHPQIKAICRGLKRSLILQNYRTAGQLREYLETMQWS
jgi:serine/threonine protein kinase